MEGPTFGEMWRRGKISFVVAFIMASIGMVGTLIILSPIILMACAGWVVVRLLGRKEDLA